MLLILLSLPSSSCIVLKSRGKGFAGGMKRWGFKGQPASHGVSVAHRSIGSTGARNVSFFSYFLLCSFSAVM